MKSAIVVARRNLCLRQRFISGTNWNYFKTNERMPFNVVKSVFLATKYGSYSAQSGASKPTAETGRGGMRKDSWGRSLANPPPPPPHTGLPLDPPLMCLLVIHIFFRYTVFFSPVVWGTHCPRTATWCEQWGETTRPNKSCWGNLLWFISYFFLQCQYIVKRTSVENKENYRLVLICHSQFLIWPAVSVRRVDESST